MKHETPHWLVIGVALGLFAFSGTAIAANGFQMYMAYPMVLGIINLLAVWMMKS